MENKADINSSTFVTKLLLLVLFLSFGIFKVFLMFRVSESKEIQYIATRLVPEFLRSILYLKDSIKLSGSSLK